MLTDNPQTEDEQDQEEKKRIQQGVGEDAQGNPSTTLTEEEKKRARQEIVDRERKRDELAAQFDRSGQPNYNVGAVGGPPVERRAAPVVSAPSPITAAQAGGPERIASNLNTADAEAARRRNEAYLDRLTAIAEGRGGPSAAELQMQRGNAAAVAQAYSLAAGHKGYSGAAMRSAQRVGAGLAQQNVTDTGILRAKEQEAAMAQLGQGIAAGRQQDIGLALGAGAQGLDAARANQAAKLSTDLQNAGFSQQAILQMSAQELQTKLANAGFNLTQQQIDDLRAHNQQSIAVQRQALQQQWNLAQQQGDTATQNALLGMAGQLGMTLLTMSDARVKHEIEPMSEHDAKEFLGTLSSGYKYRYDKGAGPGGDHFGPMAQDLERSRIGRTLVVTDERGLKSVDTSRLALALAAAVGASAKKRGA